jgi:hypothetical protein
VRVTVLSSTRKPLLLRYAPQPSNLRPWQVTKVTEVNAEGLYSWASWNLMVVSLLLSLSLSVRAPPRQLSSNEVSAEAECDLMSEVRTWPVREVTLSALLAGALCLSGMVAAAAESAAAAAAHPGAAPSDPMYPLRSVCPSEADPECRALLALSPTPSPAWSSSS